MPSGTDQITIFDGRQIRTKCLAMHVTHHQDAGRHGPEFHFSEKEMKLSKKEMAGCYIRQKLMKVQPELSVLPKLAMYHLSCHIPTGQR